MDFRFVVLAALLAAHATSAPAELPAKLLDASDGYFDLSDYLLRHRGVLPLPIVVTEPAIGYGGCLGLAYFSQSFEERAEASRARGEPVQPPDISLAVALGTESGTWAAGAGHIQQLVRRIGSSPWFAGARYTYVTSKSRFAGAVPADVPQRSLDVNIGLLGAVVSHDSRDNIFTPNRGLFFEMEAAFARGTFGSDANYRTACLRSDTRIAPRSWARGRRAGT